MTEESKRKILKILENLLDGEAVTTYDKDKFKLKLDKNGNYILVKKEIKKCSMKKV
jgi:hypothetical protein